MLAVAEWTAVRIVGNHPPLVHNQDLFYSIFYLILQSRIGMNDIN